MEALIQSADTGAEERPSRLIQRFQKGFRKKLPKCAVTAVSALFHEKEGGYGY